MVEDALATASKQSLFDDTIVGQIHFSHSARSLPALGRRRHADGAAAIATGDSGDCRVLRRVQPREICPAHHMELGEAAAVIVDIETGGLDRRRGEAIELGTGPVEGDQVGQIGPVIRTLRPVRHPADPIRPEIARPTNDNVGMVAGRVLGFDTIPALLGTASPPGSRKCHGSPKISSWVGP